MGSSESSSRFMINLIKGSNPNDALKDTFIVKQVTLGISNIEDSKVLKSLYPEEYVHTSLFISDQDEDSFEEKGIVLEFGKYESSNNENGLMKYEYKSGGMRFGWVELKEFQEKLASDISINLDIRPLLIFRELIDKIKLNDNWDFNSYSAAKHNCQHFCAKAISILKAKYISNGVTIKNNARHKYGKKKDIIPSLIQNALGI